MADTSSIPVLQLTLAGVGAGALSAGSLLAYSVFMPRCQFWAPVIRSLPEREEVAITFDDGPHPEFTPRILDILRDAGVTGTFFVIGRLAREQPELLKRICAEGHAIGNHSLDHDHFGVNRNRKYWEKQVGETQRIVAEITGELPVVFRPPMGFKTWHIAAAAKREKLPIIGWSVRGFDTRKLEAAELSRYVLKHTSGHDIIVLHDGIDPHRAAREKGATQIGTVEALAGILAGIREKKLRIVPLIDALVAGAATREAQVARMRARAAT